MTRVLVVSDTHCGHKTGLTPPDWQYKTDTKSEHLRKLGDIQRAIWGFWNWSAETFKPDVVLHIGDVIDGTGDRSGGTEEITTDREEQVEMAVQAFSVFKTDRFHVVRGTPYHTGKEEDWENVFATRIGAGIGDHSIISVEGVMFDLKHKIGASSIPHGRATAINRERLWSSLWAERDMMPSCNYIIRGHVHYHAAAGAFNQWQMTAPCLQWGTKFGSRQCSGTIDLGCLVFDCHEGEATWKAWPLDMRFTKAEAVKI